MKRRAHWEVATFIVDLAYSCFHRSRDLGRRERTVTRGREQHVTLTETVSIEMSRDLVDYNFRERDRTEPRVGLRIVEHRMPVNGTHALSVNLDFASEGVVAIERDTACLGEAKARTRC